jgi:hypothetical protein
MSIVCHRKEQEAAFLKVDSCKFVIHVLGKSHPCPSRALTFREILLIFK